MIAAPTHDYRRTEFRAPTPPFKGADALVHGLIGAYKRRSRIADDLKEESFSIDALAPQFIELSDHDLHVRLMEFRAAFRASAKPKTETVRSALAAIREAADRQLGLRAFPVQLSGALSLYRGCLVEMATGEGKTLTAGLAAVMAGWTKRPCHVLTVNDYLVQRDAEWLRPLFHFCGVRVGFVTGAMDTADRSKGYAADVTYTTSKELLADFLRDRLRLGRLAHPTRRLIQNMLRPRAAADGLVLRGLHTAIVDEADSILIDEAVTPLIIAASHKNELLKNAAEMARDLADALRPDVHYRPNSKFKEVELTPAGLGLLVRSAETLPGLWRGQDRRVELVVQALVAREFFHRDQQYIVENGKVVIVDEFTGRPMVQRTWREGMHQAIEAKEHLPISDPTETVARLSFQRFFRCFHKLSGMTGTAREAARELWQSYHLQTVPIPPNKPCIRKQLPDRVFATEEAKWAAIAGEIQTHHASGRPLLVGTRSVSASERLAALLIDKGLEPKILNASRLAEEAQIIVTAGELGRITIATNMAGRGTDIKLGRGVRELGGLHVIATERHESGRVDRQLFGRAGRQGDPGSAQAFWSAEDELICRYLPAATQRFLKRALEKRWPGSTRIAEFTIASAQRNAQKLAYNQRRAVLASDLWLDQALSFTGEAI
jgi:preprotein translocase subunit SecA